MAPSSSWAAPRAIGLEIARHYAAAGSPVDSGRSRESVDAGLADLPAGVEESCSTAEPDAIDASLAGVGPVRRLVLVAIDRDANSIADYSIERAIRLVTLKLVGFTQVVVSLRERFTEDASLVLFGGMAKERPSRLDDRVDGQRRHRGSHPTLVEELKPLRVGSIHPGIVGDSPFWAEKPAAVESYRSQTPTGRRRGCRTRRGDGVPLENEGDERVELVVDGGWHCR